MQEKESKTNWHFYISLFKSCIRITAGIALAMSLFVESGVLLVIAELLGIVEEL